MVCLSQAGMFPTYTLTEDYAFGMELKKKRFHARYVREYLAMGEAPHQVRNCFQQRSRWTKVSPSPSACTQQASSVHPAPTGTQADPEWHAWELGTAKKSARGIPFVRTAWNIKLTRALCCMLCSG